MSGPSNPDGSSASPAPYGLNVAHDSRFSGASMDVEIELESEVGRINLVCSQRRWIRYPAQRRHEAVPGRECKVVPPVGIAFDVDLRG